ncbi:MAG: dihydropteroate synthase [Cyclobacteriaceae bacterium]
MGIINITPDSFYAGSRIQEIKGVLLQAEKMLEEGATFLDIGGYSSRPGAKDISAEEELSRVVAPIEAIAKEFPEAYLSIDTFRSTVAKEAVAYGAHIVNDISAGLLDDDMLQTVGNLRVPYIGMHMKGAPQTMKEMSDYDDLIREVALYFAERTAAAQAAGILDFIADPGIGFAKTADQSFEVLKHLEYFHDLGFTTLCGVSRKSLIYKSLNITPEAALNGTTVLNTVALMKGVSLLRVHDVKPAMEAINLINKVQI